jgi:hypothetical protein
MAAKKMPSNNTNDQTTPPSSFQKNTVPLITFKKSGMIEMRAPMKSTNNARIGRSCTLNNKKKQSKPKVISEEVQFKKQILIIHRYCELLMVNEKKRQMIRTISKLSFHQCKSLWKRVKTKWKSNNKTKHTKFNNF